MENGNNLLPCNLNVCMLLSKIFLHEGNKLCLYLCHVGIIELSILYFYMYLLCFSFVIFIYCLIFICI